jgi:PAS domain-containing protein
MADALPASRALTKPKEALVRLFGAKPPSVLDDLAGRSDPAIRALFDGAVSGLLLIDVAGRIARANPALRAMLANDVELAASSARCADLRRG